jgi:hypothetical protein
VTPSVLLIAYLVATPHVVIGIQQSVSLASGRTVYVREGEHARIALSNTTQHGNCGSEDAHAKSLDAACAMPLNFASQSVRWFLLVPEARDYDNPAYCQLAKQARSCHQPIAYHEEELPTLSGVTSFDVANIPQLRAPGTHRIAAHLVWNGLALSAPGPESSSKDYATASAVDVVVRRDDSYVGLLSELLGTPFVLGPTYVTGLGHETDRRVAADCVALVIYGRRRLGEGVPYMAPAALRERLTVVDKAGSLVDSNDRPVRVGPLLPGDVLYFGFQTAVVSDGLSADGYLTRSTKIIHTYHGLAEEVEVSDLPYRRSAVEILRWNVRPR